MTDRQDAGPSDPARPRIAVAVCTYERNEPLRTLLKAVVDNAEQLGQRAELGVVVVDDTPEGNARAVVDGFSGRFDLGLVYRVSGRQNISLARNMALEEALQMGDWTAMTDDDCEPTPSWLAHLIDVQRRTGADVVTGPMIRRPPPGSPAWLTDEPFLEAGLGSAEDGEALDVGSTHNALIANRWLRDHPSIRFDPALGVLGGEDMAFYHRAYAEGLRIHHAARAVVYENEPPSRTTLAYQLRLYLWLGNSAHVTGKRNGTGSLRLLMRALNALRRALQRPIGRIGRGQAAQLRYALATVSQALGMMIAVFGIELRHH